MTSRYDDAIKLNCALIEAFGLDPRDVSSRPEPTIRLDKNRGPVLSVTLFCFDEDGKKSIIDGEVATMFRRYAFMPYVPAEEIIE